MDIEDVFGIEAAKAVEERLQSKCPLPSRWWGVKLGQHGWTPEERTHIDACEACQNTRQLLEPNIIYVRVPERKSKKLLAWKMVAAAAALIGVFARSYEKNASAMLSETIDVLKAELANLTATFERLGIRNAVRFEESPFQVVGRDRVGLSVRFDERYVTKIEYRFNATEEFRTLFEASGPRPQVETIREESVRTDPLPLTGDVIQAELRVETYDDVRDYIPEAKRYQTRSFALTPLGVTADPPDLPEKPVDEISNDADPLEPHRHTVVGRLPRDKQTGELPARSYLLIYPVLSNECWVSDVIVPAADGRFFVKCFLGVRVDNQRYMLKVVSFYGSTKEAPAYRPGDQFDKLTNWEDKGFKVFDGGFKINNGQDGLEASN